MNYSQPFSALNEQLRPRYITNEQLYSSFNRLEDRHASSLRNKSSSRRTVLSEEAEPELKVPVTITEDENPEEHEYDAEQEDLVSDGQADHLPNTNMCLITELNLNNVPEDEGDEDSSTSQSDGKDSPCDLASEETGDPSEPAALQRSFMDGSLPDLIKSGRPLGRRRTLTHVSATVGSPFR